MSAWTHVITKINEICPDIYQNDLTLVEINAITLILVWTHVRSK